MRPLLRRARVTLNIVFNSPNHKNPDLDLDDYADHQMLGTFFEGLGILVKKGLIDVELVDDLLSQRIIWYWETQVQPIEDMARASLGDSALYDSIDYLYEKMKNRHQSTAVST